MSIFPGKVFSHPKEATKHFSLGHIRLMSRSELVVNHQLISAGKAHPFRISGRHAMLIMLNIRMNKLTVLAKVTRHLVLLGLFFRPAFCRVSLVFHLCRFKASLH